MTRGSVLYSPGLKVRFFSSSGGVLGYVQISPDSDVRVAVGSKVIYSMLVVV